MKNKIRLGMVGGGPESMFGKTHRLAAARENQYELVCGAFSRDHNKSLTFNNQELQLDPERVYADYATLIKTEASLPAEKRMQVLSIVTPNNSHFAIAKLALENGFHIILEKPITLTVNEAKTLADLVHKTGLQCMVCYTNIGFPMIQQARHMIDNGDLGRLRFVDAKYYQGWLSTAIEAQQAVWRTDPLQSGMAGTIADIGIHAFNLIEFLTQQKVIAINADLQRLIPQRKLDDYGSVLLRFEQGMPGLLATSQAAPGEGWNLEINIYGDKAKLQWRLENPSELHIGYSDKPNAIIKAGDHNSWLSQAALRNGRLPAGKGENSVEALTNLYCHFAKTLRGEKLELGENFPSIEDGVRGMQFIETAVASTQSNLKWLPLGEIIKPDLSSNNFVTDKNNFGLFTQSFTPERNPANNQQNNVTFKMT